MHDIYVKIHEGTRSDATDLCKSCTKAVIIRGAASGNEKRFCHATSYDQPLQLTHTVSSCSEYYNSNLPSRSDFEKSAWVLCTTKGRNIGFMPAAEWRLKHKDDDLIPE